MKKIPIIFNIFGNIIAWFAYPIRKLVLVVVSVIFTTGGLLSFQLMFDIYITLLSIPTEIFIREVSGLNVKEHLTWL